MRKHVVPTSDLSSHRHKLAVVEGYLTTNCYENYETTVMSILESCCKSGREITISR
jgi:hypothetical protein